MEFIHLLKSVAIALGIAILIPVAVDLGVRLVIKEPASYPLGFPDDQDEKQESYEHNLIKYQTTFFYISLFVGLLFIILGAAFHIAAGAGFILGGVFTLAHGYLVYWRQLSLLIKFFSAFGILALLFAISLWSTKHKKK